MKNQEAYKNPYGIWRVTTEDDCEGKSICDLGIHKGYIDDIAFGLADKQYYSLQFSAVDPRELDMTPKRNEVFVSLDIDSDTWGMKDKELISFWEEMMKNRNVTVRKGRGYNVVTLTSNRRTVEDIRQEALAKLTEKERAALGL